MPFTGSPRIERNKIVILTGAGGEFMSLESISHPSATSPIPAFGSQVHDEGVQLLENIANIRVPVHRGYRGTSPCALRICRCLRM